MFKVNNLRTNMQKMSTNVPIVSVLKKKSNENSNRIISNSNGGKLKFAFRNFLS